MEQNTISFQDNPLFVGVLKRLDQSRPSLAQAVAAHLPSHIDMGPTMDREGSYTLTFKKEGIAATCNGIAILSALPDLKGVDSDVQTMLAVGAFLLRHAEMALLTQMSTKVLEVIERLKAQGSSIESVETIDPALWAIIENEAGIALHDDRAAKQEEATKH